MLNNTSLYFHTLRHLKPVQFYGRVWRRLYRPSPDLSSAPSLRERSGLWLPSLKRRQSVVAATRLRFLNEEHDVASGPDWDNPAWEKLWRYNLHYFDDLNASGAASRSAWHQALIARWVAENPPADGTGWEPYPASLRIVNWIKWAFAGGNLGKTAEHSLAVQARFLFERIEWHLLGNHLFANAKALVFAGSHFDGAEAQGWLHKGMDIMGAQIEEQVLPDGGHFERSPMYHAIVLEDVLDLINLSRSYPGVMPENLSETLRTVAGKMLRWASLMSHPDGGISFFNDAALGVAASFADLSRYAEQLGVGVHGGGYGGLTCLHPSGYIRLVQGTVNLIFDVGPVGPDYLPGHAHADTLSFELCYSGQRVLCNSGTSQYGRGKIRLWERSTAAHNTVEIDGENSSEVWDSFRVARRAYPVGLSWSEEAQPLRASCGHDGYTRLHGRPMHRRTVEVADNRVRWTDEVEGAGEHRVVGRIPLHPDVVARRLSEAQWQLNLPSGENLVLAVETADVVLDEERGRFSPEFGLTLERTVLVWAISGKLPFSVALSLGPIEN